MANQKIAVIGAGPAGMAAAYELVKQGKTVDVYEASNTVGGMSKTISLWNQKVDLGPHHFVSNDKRVSDLWLEVVGKDYDIIKRLTRILYKDRLFFYPLRLANVLRNLGVVESWVCVLSYFRQRVTPVSDDGSFQNWVVRKFGRRLFEIFFKAYSEKLWGLSCQELDAEFAVQRIKRLSLFEAVKHAVFNGKGNTHKSLVGQFAYPHGGAGIVYERMAAFIEAHGGKIHYESPVKRLLTQDNTITALELMNGEVRAYDHIVSSMPLTLLVMNLPEVPQAVRQAASELRFRNTILVYLNVEATDLFPDNWLYVHTDTLKMGRITNFRNWTPQLYGAEKTSILVLEYWCFDDEALWAEPDEQLIARGTQELQMTGLIRDASVLDGKVYRIQRCYPIYDRGYKIRLKQVESYLSTLKGLSVIGRYGAFKYNNQDHSLLMGILAAENIAQGTEHNLWAINADYEYHQERLSETFYAR